MKLMMCRMEGGCQRDTEMIGSKVHCLAHHLHFLAIVTHHEAINGTRLEAPSTALVSATYATFAARIA